MSKHTPGPWTVEDPMGFELSIVEATKQPYDWEFIASIPLPEDDCEEFSKEICVANARLISAAPDLLELANDALPALEALLLARPDDEVLADLAFRHRAAIAKATGEA